MIIAPELQRSGFSFCHVPMPFSIRSTENIDLHFWAVLHASCDLSQDADSLVSMISALTKYCYGGTRIIETAEAWNAKIDPGVSNQFDMSSIERAFKKGLPNPDAEGNKPKQLTNYRSESAEMVARAALQKAYDVIFPAAPQQGKTNPNQPILGFDGWGLLSLSASEKALLLFQVKGTDEAVSPPKAVQTLIDECKAAPTQIANICRALSALVCALPQDMPIVPDLLGMMVLLGQDRSPSIVVSPAIVRGITVAEMTDLQPLKDNRRDFDPHGTRCVAVSIGVDLNDFGLAVANKIRNE
jgi:hypothetical protein